jgi:aminopeptidase N
MINRVVLVCFSLLLAVFAGAEDLRGDTIDICSYNLKLDLSDFTTKVMKADATVGIKAKKNGIDGIHLDLQQLTVDSVRVNSFVVPYTYNSSVLDINLLTTLNTGDSATLQIYYHGTPYHGAGDFGGFYWTGTYAFNIGVSFLEDPHNYGRVLFPCFDNFEERSLYEFYVTTKSNHKAFCNGLLLGVTTSSNKKTWHWKLGQEIPSYLASVAVSDYATVSDTVNGVNGVIPIQLAANAADTAVMKALFVNLHNAFHIQEELWGPYQWDRVGYCIVPFNAGAMEHATNIGFMIHYLTALADQAETTMAHELSHHWFGDLVTCDSASEMWLNEGWARYNEHLFLERQYGDSVYKQTVRENHESVLHDAHISDGSYLPVSGVPTENTYGPTVYDKGADVIHTLRHYMGDSLFFRCMKNFIADFSWKNMSTAQLRDYLSQCSGINLNDYFNDWIYAPGFPHFSIENYRKEMQLSGSETDVRVHFTIRQKLHHAPHYYSNVPVVVSYFISPFSTTNYKDTVWVSGECTEHISQWYPQMSGDIMFTALDFDGGLQDAITDEWRLISHSGTYDFGTAKMSMAVDTVLIAGPGLVRVEHNWIRPEPMRAKIPGLHLHDKRYWTVDGPNFIGFDANATLTYNRQDVSLDSSFITNREDSLVVMYRANADSEWIIANYNLDVQGNVNDGVGQMTINSVTRGQYCLAIWNSALPDTTTADADCMFSSITEPGAAKSFQLFPNPTQETVSMSFDKDVFMNAILVDINGRKLLEQKIQSGQTTAEFKMKGFANGTYLVTLTGKNGQNISKKLIKQ